MRHAHFAFLAVALPLSLAACGSCSKGDKSTSSADGEALPSGARPATLPSAFRRGTVHSGPAGALFRSARSLPDLKDEQKASIDRIEHAIGIQEAARAEIRELNVDLVSQVKQGKIDAAKNAARLGSIEKETQAQADKEADAIDQLWSALEPEQRKAVVADIHKKQRPYGAREGDAAPEADEDAGRPEAHRRIERFVHDLGLDAGQQKTIDAIFAKDNAKAADMRGSEKKDVEALFGAFEKSDKLESKKLFANEAKTVRAPLERDTELLGQIVPLLKPDQRDKLASKLESLTKRRVGRGRDLGKPMAPEDPPEAP